MNRRVALRLSAVLLLAALTACGTHPAHHARTEYNPSRYYPPPGPPSDPWGPYIREASGRFGIPERWIRRVMRQESGGQEDVISWAGAMGLMQVMPETYDELRGRYGLGDDPFDPHNNILAGSAYLKEMYDRYGSPGFLAAYNAGPNRLDRYLNDGTPLPVETVNYVAAIAPGLGPERPTSGPLAVYAGGAAPRPTPSGCDADAAYDPARPCTPARPTAPKLVAAAPVYGPGGCDPDAAYDPTQPCRPWQPPAPLPPPAVEYAPPTRRMTMAEVRPLQERLGQPVAFAVGPPPGRWAIQVGAFANLATAEGAAERARSELPELLRTAKIELPATAPFGSQVAFRARLSGLSPAVAAQACSRLTSHMPCLTVPPPGAAF